MPLSSGTQATFVRERFTYSGRALCLSRRAIHGPRGAASPQRAHQHPGCRAISSSGKQPSDPPPDTLGLG